MFQILTILGCVATVVAVGGHYLIFGPRHPDLPKEKASVKRFSSWERMIHLALLVGFLTLAITGFVAAAGFGLPLRGWLRALHIGAVPLFAVGLAGAALRWSDSARLEEHDLEWAMKCGGYLGKHHDAPAGRFNAGQKGFYWTVLGLGVVVIVTGLGRAFPLFDGLVQEILLQVHRYGSLAFLLTVLSHIYLATLANPGTIRVIFTGRVSPSWAKGHHPLWWKQIQGSAESQDEA